MQRRTIFCFFSMVCLIWCYGKSAQTDAGDSAASPAESMTATVTGRVINDRGDGIKDVVARVTVYSDSDFDDEKSPDFKLNTDRDGSYLIQIPLGPSRDYAKLEFEKDKYRAAPTICENCGAEAYVKLEKGKTFHASFVLVPEPVAGEHDQKPATSDPSLKQTSMISGRVLNAAGEPLEDALVRVAVPATDMRFVNSRSVDATIEAKTNKDGRYEIRVPEKGATTASVDAIKPGFGSASGTFQSGNEIRNLSLAPGVRSYASFILEPGLYLAGIVVDEHGDPVPNVKINGRMRHRDGHGDIEAAISQASGKFELFDFPLHADQSADKLSKGELDFRHPHYARRIVEDVYKLSADQQRSLRVVLNQGFAISGRLEDKEGNPAAYVMLEAFDGNQDRKAVLTDGEGQFAIVGLASGMGSVRAHSLKLRQKGRLSIALDQDRNGIVLAMEPAPLPDNLKTVTMLGMKLANVDEPLARLYDIDSRRGVMIVDPGSRAESDGLAEGDVFYSVGEGAIGDLRGFRSAVLREDELQSGNNKGCRVVYGFSRVNLSGTRTTIIGLKATEVDELKRVGLQLPRGATFLGVSGIGSGVCQIRAVQPGSVAEKGGLKANDIILKFNGVEVKKFTELLDEVKKVPLGKEVPVELSREGEPLNLKVVFD